MAIGSIASAQTSAYNLDFNPDKYDMQTLSLNGKTFSVRAFEKLVYVANPVDTTYQILNIYIPEEYFQGKSNHGYTAATAPIFFPNQIGGYMPAQPASTKNSSFGGMLPSDGKKPDGAFGERPAMPAGGDQRQSAVLAALSRGYIVASPGARGRTTQDKNGVYTGKAPAVIVDLKAAVRYLKYNDAKMPGDATKIVSNGTSAGGALSALLGATGNNPDYEPFLKELGAAEATDDIFAVSAYCPITNLDHADMAYEWQFNGVNDYKKMSIGSLDYNVKRTETADVLSKEQLTVSTQLKELFPKYVNGLKLKDRNGKRLTLDKNGNGNFKELVKAYVIASAQKTLDAGTDLSAHSWLTITDKKVTDIDFNAYVRYMERMKTPPAFDGLDLSTGENQLFGTPAIDKQHFITFSVNNSTVDATRVDGHIVKLMNPMYYIGHPNTKISQNWRIRHGSKDRDTSLAIAVILGTYLENKGYQVDLEFPWDKPHSGDYDLEELFRWIDGICK